MRKSKEEVVCMYVRGITITIALLFKFSNLCCFLLSQILLKAFGLTEEISEVGVGIIAIRKLSLAIGKTIQVGTF